MHLNNASNLYPIGSIKARPLSQAALSTHSIAFFTEKKTRSSDVKEQTRFSPRLALYAKIVPRSLIKSTISLVTAVISLSSLSSTNVHLALEMARRYITK